MRIRLLLPLLAAFLLVPAASVATPEPATCSITAEGVQCCKICRKGKPCGDTCISKKKACRSPKGCACAG